MAQRLGRLGWLVPVVLVLVGALLRFYHLGDKGLWGDELAQAKWSLFPLGKLWADFRDPPDYLLHFLLTRLAQLVGTQEFFVRLPSAMAGIAAVAGQYAAARRLTDSATALVATLLLAVSPFEIWYAQDARMYSAHALYTILAMYFFARLRDKPDWRAVLGLSAANTLAVYNHFFGLMLPLIQLVCAVGLLIGANLRPEGNGKFRLPNWSLPLAASFFVCLICIIPLMPGTLPYIANPTTKSAIEGMFQKSQFHLSPEFMGQLANDFGAGPDGGWRTFGSLACALVGLGGLAQTRYRSAWIIGVWLLLPLALLEIVRPERVVADRYLILIQPAYLILIAAGVMALWRSGSKLLARVGTARRVRFATGVACAVLFLLVAIPPLQALYARAKLNDWQTIARFLSKNARPGDVLIGEKNFWAIKALEDYVPNLGAYSIPPGTVSEMNKLLEQDRRIWYISFGGFLNPAEEAWVRTHLERVPNDTWERSDLCYAHCGEFTFSQSEELVTLYRHDAGIPPRIAYSNELGTWSGPRPFLPVRSARPLEARLALATNAPRVLKLEYYAAPGIDFQVEVNHEAVARIVETPGKGGWKLQTWELPRGAADEVTIRVVNRSADAVLRVRSVALENE